MGIKGYASKIVPVEDMPYMEKMGRPVDVVLNSTEVFQARMNVGQDLRDTLRLGMLRNLEDEFRNLNN